MELTNTATLPAKAEEVAKLSNGFVTLQRSKAIHGKRQSQHWLLFIDGKYIRLIRSARAMSFCDGYLLASVTSMDNKKALLIESEG